MVEAPVGALRTVRALASAFEALGGLDPDDIADLIAYVTSRRHVNLRQAILVPTKQPS
jgi:NADP-dependent 3-hydroxy acid dehydrogenase YdfG